MHLTKITLYKSIMSVLDRPQFKPFSKYPIVTRDITVVMDDSKPYNTIEKSLYSIINIYKDINSYKLLSIYKYNNSINYTIRLIISSIYKTFNKEEIDFIINLILYKLNKDCDAVLKQ